MLKKDVENYDFKNIFKVSSKISKFFWVMIMTCVKGVCRIFILHFFLNDKIAPLIAQMWYGFKFCVISIFYFLEFHNICLSFQVNFI